MRKRLELQWLWMAFLLMPVFSVAGPAEQGRAEGVKQPAAQVGLAANDSDEEALAALKACGEWLAGLERFAVTAEVTADEIFTAETKVQRAYQVGYFYRRSGAGYVTVTAPAGAIVTLVPDGAVWQGNLLVYNGTSYRKIANGDDVDYEVVSGS